MGGDGAERLIYGDHQVKRARHARMRIFVGRLTFDNGKACFFPIIRKKKKEERKNEKHVISV